MHLQSTYKKIKQKMAFPEDKISNSHTNSARNHDKNALKSYYSHGKAENVSENNWIKLSFGI